MRTLKFKAWDKKYNRWSISATTIIDRFQKSLPDCELLQFTGLLDKQGKEIYEGDILRLTCGCGHQENLPVCSRDNVNGYFARTKYQHDWDNNQLDLGGTEKDAEVIGNIYEGILPLDKMHTL